MRKTIVATDRAAPAVGPYSQGIRLGDLVFASGQLPIAPETGAMPEGVEAQTRQSIANLKAVLEAAGAGLDTVVKTTVFLKDMDEFASMNAVYGGVFAGQPPARSTVEVARLPRDARVEIEAIAFVKQD
ncbi:RidA family protein [Azospirillum sp. RWY-5-1]|uniref:RidA family protein n=1 Tax=Azospirillum oleiclasticum TaxID=2735135 RepID=A0ABX2TMU8_9PROT|nr:RidA family protein [Azospirillum oleiclasticum]NYZ17464.1 RidA family protein [Azospirillum oleiclasticum]NYZ24843.1 RidA family protein [Azospirillum oleiclasticum]